MNESDVPRTELEYIRRKAGLLTTTGAVLMLGGSFVGGVIGSLFQQKIAAELAPARTTTALVEHPAQDALLRDEGETIIIEPAPGTQTVIEEPETTSISYAKAVKAGVKAVYKMGKIIITSEPIPKAAPIASASPSPTASP